MLRFLTAGESHGPGLTAILEGIPAGLSLSTSEIDLELARRQKGFGSGGRMKIEKDIGPDFGWSDGRRNDWCSLGDVGGERRPHKMEGQNRSSDDCAAAWSCRSDWCG